MNTWKSTVNKVIEKDQLRFTSMETSKLQTTVSKLSDFITEMNSMIAEVQNRLSNNFTKCSRGATRWLFRGGAK